MAELDCFSAVLDAVAGHPPLRVAVVGADEPGVLEGVLEAVEAELIDPVLVGDETGVREAASVAGVDVSPFPLVEAADELAAAAAASRLVTEGEVGGLVKGRVHTSAFLGPVVRHLRTDRRISHAFVLELPSYHKLLTVTDAAVNISPDLAAKRAITQNGVDLTRAFGVTEAKVAALSAVELVNPAIPSSVDAACLAVMGQRHQIKGAVVDGPLAFDLAISAESADVKRVDSPVAGDVDVLVVPDLDAGNILVKDLAYLAGATLAGVVLGAAVPCVLTSRADPPRARVLSCALAVLAAELGPTR